MIDLEHMAKTLGIGKADVLEIVRRAPERYKEYEIPKRAGGTRSIAQPSRELKAVQRYLAAHALDQFPLSKHATAYRTGKSIRYNAAVHAKSKYILKTDFAEFFHSFHHVDFDWLLLRNDKNIAKEEINFLKYAIFWRPKAKRTYTLAMGAPTSPLVSNIFLYEIDESIGEFCAENDIKYTRYADDVTFSAMEMERLIEVEGVFSKIIASVDRPRLKFNGEKRGLYGPGQRREVTGLIITPDGQISIGRDRKRLISAGVDRWRKGGLKTDLEVEQLRGKLAFAKSAEPKFLASMERKYGSSLIKSLMSREKRSFWSPSMLFGE